MTNLTTTYERIWPAQEVSRPRKIGAKRVKKKKGTQKHRDRK